jgi:hypothetical protein
MLLSAGAISAAPLTGTLAITGTVAVGPTNINFSFSGPNGPFALPVGAGTGDFSSVTCPNGAPCNISGLNVLTEPPGTTFLLPGFMTFGNAPIRFDLTSIAPGAFSTCQAITGPAALGQTCTPPSFQVGNTTIPNPFTLVNGGAPGAIAATASLSLAGTVVNLTDNSISNFTGTLQTTFNNPPIPYQLLLSTIQSGGSVNSTFSGTFNVTSTAVVPEPASLILLGSSLLGFFALCRYRRARSFADR